VALNYDLLLDLIDLSVNDPGGNGLDGPLLDVLLLNVQGLSEVLILVIRVLKLERAYLHILLLPNDISDFELLIRQQALKGLDLGLEFLGVGLSKKGHEVEDFLILPLQAFHCLELEDVGEIDDGGHYHSENDTALGLLLNVELGDFLL